MDALGYWAAINAGWHRRLPHDRRAGPPKTVLWSSRTQLTTVWMNYPNLVGFSLASVARNRGSARASPVKSARIAAGTQIPSTSAPAAPIRHP